MEAVRLLADRCGLQVPDDAENDQRSQIKKRVLEINRETARFYFDALMSPQGKEAYNYLIRRGRDRKTIRHFGLGYSPKGWDELIRHLKSKGFSEEEMLEANVAMRGRRGTTFPDVISIQVTLTQFTGVRLRLHYVMTKEGGPVVFEGNSEHCFQDQQGHILRLRKAFPAFAQALDQQLAAGQEA